MSIFFPSCFSFFKRRKNISFSIDTSDVLIKNESKIHLIKKKIYETYSSFDLISVTSTWNYSCIFIQKLYSTDKIVHRKDIPCSCSIILWKKSMCKFIQFDFSLVLKIFLIPFGIHFLYWIMSFEIRCVEWDSSINFSKVNCWTNMSNKIPWHILFSLEELDITSDLSFNQ